MVIGRSSQTYAETWRAWQGVGKSAHKYGSRIKRVVSWLPSGSHVGIPRVTCSEVSSSIIRSPHSAIGHGLHEFIDLPAQIEQPGLSQHFI